MTLPLMILAVGTIVVGFIGIPRTLGGANAIEHFLAPSFTETRGVLILKRAGEPDPPGTQERLAQAREELERDRAAHRAAFPVTEATQGRAWALMLLSTLLAAAGMGAAWRFYVIHPDVPRRVMERWSGLHALLLNKYYVDDLYDAVLVWPVVQMSREFLWKFVDMFMIDGAVNGIGQLIRGSAGGLRHMQSGYVRTYAGWILLGGVLVIMWFLK